MVDRQGHDKKFCIVSLAKYSFISKKYANFQIPLTSPFRAPFYYTSLTASHAKPHHPFIFKTIKFFCVKFKCVLGRLNFKDMYFVHLKVLREYNEFSTCAKPSNG